MPPDPPLPAGTAPLLTDEQTIRRIIREEVEAALASRGPPPLTLLDKAAAADALGVSVRTVERLVASGEIAAVRVRGRVQFAPGALEAYARANAQMSGSRRRSRRGGRVPG